MSTPHTLGQARMPRTISSVEQRGVLGTMGAAVRTDRAPALPTERAGAGQEEAAAGGAAGAGPGPGAAPAAAVPAPPAPVSARARGAAPAAEPGASCPGPGTGTNPPGSGSARKERTAAAGGYYLTSAYGALSLIKNFQEEQAAQLLSSEARDTLRQWHKRRTTNRTIPSVDDFQNYLRAAFQEVTSGCTGKTLLVRPYITTEDVCQLCAEKFKVANPEEYRLFLFVDDTWQQLTEDTYPQKIKAELQSRAQPQVFHFVYKRLNSDPYGAILQSSNDSAA